MTVTDGSGYTAGDPASDTVALRDDDVPAVTVSAGSAVTEGGNATFTLTANPAPAAPLAVSVTVATDGRLRRDRRRADRHPPHDRQLTR